MIFQFESIKLRPRHNRGHIIYMIQTRLCFHDLHSHNFLGIFSYHSFSLYETLTFDILMQILSVDPPTINKKRPDIHAVVQSLFIRFQALSFHSSTEIAFWASSIF